MKPGIWAAFTLAFALASACTHRAQTYPFVWQLRGAVVAASDSRFQVRHKTGYVIDLRIDDHTVFVRNKQSESWHVLLRGTRVTVEVEMRQQGGNYARRVQVFGGGRPW